MDQDLARVRTLFDEVIQAAPEDRARLLDARCASDFALRQRLEALVAAAESDDPFLSQPTRSPAAMSTLAAPPVTERPGARIGPYRLLQEIGEGGFGVVFMAEQDQPVRRRVALKIIKPGMDTRQVVSRFDQERQALALMDHPNIAKVFDAGATESGRPYFVMEYVKGDPITDFADAHRLSVSDRLHLFTQVCAAVQHAHTKGVVHRDLKPRNVLVCMSDGRPFAKVIDFGIAKATGPRLTEKTLFTEHRQLIGTPEYMSPEQAEGSPDIDTRTDVYSLGVLLYELLTGATPFDAERLRSAAYAEMQRIIKEEEPPAPSLRLSRDLRALAAAATARRAERGKLGTLVKGELDWIVMKALDKDRARRYETPSQFAADVQRHLAGEPVDAAPPSASYRARKFIRRHKGRVAAALAILAVLLIGTITTSTGFALEFKQRQRAQAAASVAESARAAETDARMESDIQRRVAERNAYVASLIAAASDPYTARRQLDACPEHLRGWEWRYLHARSDTSTLVIHDSTPPSYGAPSSWLSPDGTRVVTTGNFGSTGGSNAAVSVWETGSGRCLLALQEAARRASFAPDGASIALCTTGGVQIHDASSGLLLLTVQIDRPTSAWYSPDGARLLTFDQPDSRRQVWNARTGELLATLPTPGSRMYGSFATWSPDGERILIDGARHEAIIVSAATGQTLVTLTGHADDVVTGHFSPDGGRIITGGAEPDCTARIWDAQTGEILAELRGHQSNVVSAVFSPDGGRVLTQSWRGDGRIWDAASGRLLAALDNGDNGGFGSSLSPDGALAMTTGGPCARLWDGRTGRLLATLMGHSEWIHGAAFSPDGARIVTTSYDGTVRLWDADPAVHLNPVMLAAPQGEYEFGGTDHVEFSADGQRILSNDYWGNVFVWDSANHRLLCGLRHDTLGPEEISRDRRASLLARSSRLLTWVDGEGGVRAWDVKSGAEAPLPFTIPAERRVQHFGLSDDRTKAVVGLNGGLLRVIDMVTGGTLVERQMLPEAPWGVFSPDASRMAVKSANGWSILDVTSGSIISQLTGPAGSARTVVFGHHNDRVVTVHEDLTTRLWDAHSGALLASLGEWSDRRSGSWEPSFSSDDRRILTRSTSLVQVWSALDGSHVATLNVEPADVSDATFSPDGLRLATCGTDDTVRIWDPETGVNLATMRIRAFDEGGLWCLAFSPDGSRLAVGSYDGPVYLFDATARREHGDQ